MEGDSVANILNRLRVGLVICVAVNAAHLSLTATDISAADASAITQIVTVQSIDVPPPAAKKDDTVPSLKARPDGDRGSAEPSDGSEAGHTDQPWDFQAPGCPYEEGPLDLIV